MDVLIPWVLYLGFILHILGSCSPVCVRAFTDVWEIPPTTKMLLLLFYFIFWLIVSVGFTSCIPLQHGNSAIKQNKHHVIAYLCSWFTDVERKQNPSEGRCRNYKILGIIFDLTQWNVSVKNYCHVSKSVLKVQEGALDKKNTML